MKKILAIIFTLACFYKAKAQINFDFTDSLANQQKQYIIRFDVANGNIYLPVKKKAKSKDGKPSLFKRDILKMTDSVPVTLYKDTIINGSVVKWKYSFQKITNPALKNQKDTIRYLAAGRYFKPSVGSFIRLVFENVPKNMDVGVNAEFLDKNLEDASTFEGFLNRYASAFDTGVSRDVKKLINDSSAIEIKKKVDSNNIKLKDSINTFKNNTDSIINTIKEIKALLGPNDLSSGNSSLIGRVKIKPQKERNNQSSRLDGLLDDLRQLKLIDSIRPNHLDTILIKIKTYVSLIEDNNKISVDSNQKLQNKLDTLKNKASVLENSKNSIAGLINLVNALKEQIDSSHKNFDSTLLKLYDSIYNRRVIYIQPIQVPNNDISLLKITYKTAGNPQKDVYREIMLKNKLGFKLDFSTGFIGTGLKDDYYRLVPAPNTIKDTATIIADPKGNFAIGFGILAHAYMRTGERVNLAINTGLMLNGSNQTINYLGGLSLPLGLEARFVVSGGVAFGKVKRLTSGFLPDKAYPSSVLNLSSGVPYTEKWQNSWYVGVSYNLSSLTASSHKSVIAK